MCYNIYCVFNNAPIAQLGEHFFYTEGVIGSSPIGSTENGLSYNTPPQDRKIARNIIR